MRQLVILGAPGTVGRNTLDVARRHPQRLQVLALTANRDVAGLVALCREFQPRYAATADASKWAELRDALAGTETEALAGAEAVAQLAAHEAADLVMSAIVGAAGLLPTLAAVRAGKRVLVANKEPLVMAGELMMQAAATAGATLVPIDSEHNAIFQCLPEGYRCGTPDSGVRRIILTASGGPFRETELSKLRDVTPAEAVRHPNWVMGPKISVDSATMMNKGLELIEARWLFGLPSESIDVVLHPESVIHSLVEYRDGSMLAQLGQPDMRVPIAHALAAPERWESGVSGLSLAEVAKLHFSEVESARYPALGLARQALQAGGRASNVLNAANEVAVEAFLAGGVSFTGIASVIDESLDRSEGAGLPDADDLDSVLAIDAWARDAAHSVIAGLDTKVMHA